MRIVCDYTGVALDAAPEVAAALCGRGFTAAEPLPSLAAGLPGTPGGDGSSAPAGAGALPLPSSDGNGKGAQAPTAQSEGAAPAAPALPSFDGWENTKGFLKEREMPELRAYAAANGVELPRPANKGQIVNAILAALEA